MVRILPTHNDAAPYPGRFTAAAEADPLYRVRNILRGGQERLTDRQRARLTAAFTAREEHLEVEIACQAAQAVRAVYHHDTH